MTDDDLQPGGPDGDAKPKPPRGRGQVATIGSAVVLLLVALMAVYLIVSDPPEEEVRRPAAGAAPVASPAGGEGTCPATKVTSAVPADAPSSQWTLVGTMAAPEDKANGPSQTTKRGYRTCFAHNPVGALYAAVNFVAVGTSDLRGVDAVKQYVASTPERQDMIDSPEVNDRFDEVARIQVRGYRLELVKTDRVVVNLALGVEGTANYAQLVAPMRWENGDWKLVAPADGDLTGPTLADLSGYVEWSGA